MNISSMEKSGRPPLKHRTWGSPRFGGLGEEKAEWRSPGEPRRIEIRLREIKQLFNSMDPSPFHEKDLDHDAEDFIFSWVQECHRDEPVKLVVHLEEAPDGKHSKTLIEQAIHHYFSYRAKMNWLELRRLLRQGRSSLLVGFSFLAVCLIASNFIARRQPGSLMLILKEALTIAGTVAMWRPMEIYLYEWWPLRRRGQIFEKMGRMPVEVTVDRDLD